ncbi:barstar family protein [Deinococcus navajonensis]|uniref:Barstar family protein n=1 Tax=Deinococcus navajonensis TaxID=309884 RepID=A0ABV8XN15_9DEIO
MMQVFSAPPDGLQHAPHEVRLLAAGHQIGVREVVFTAVHDKETLMLAFLAGLGLTERFGRNWDALYDVLTDPQSRPARLALVLCDYALFRRRHATLGAQLETVLLDAQRALAAEGRDLWLLIEERESDLRHR